MLLSQSSNESLLIKKDKNNTHMFAEDDDDYEEEDEYENYKTPISEKLKLESMSVFYSKGLYPTSLGMVQGDID